MDEYGAPPPRPAWPRVVGALGVLMLTGFVVIVGARVWGSDRGITVGADAEVPEFATVDDAVGYYKDQKDALTDFLDANPFGYDPAWVDDRLAWFDDAVRGERSELFADPRVIATAGYAVGSLRDRIGEQIETWNLDYAPKPELIVNFTGTAAEAALDVVSGGVAEIAFDSKCGSLERATACVSDGTLVHVQIEYLEDEGDWTQIMTHEFAHVMQNKFWSRLWNDPDYQRLFGDLAVPAEYADRDDLDYAIEHSADCMALVRLPDYQPGYSGECTPEQLAFAATMWDGSFAND